jgi:hypothetical protein
MRAVWLLAACGLAVCSAAAAQDPGEIVRRSVVLLDRNLAVARNYTFLERSDTRELDADGHVKTRKLRLYDVTLLEGSPYRRLVGRDDRPLSPDEERDERKKLEDSIAERQKERPAQRTQRIADWEKKRKQEREPLLEVPDAFDFRLAGEESLEGRPAWVIEATPRPDFHARTSIGKLFPKFRGKLWIDKADNEWVKAAAEVTSNISFGLFLARLSKGSRFDIEMTRVNDEVWLPKRIEARAAARLVLVKTLRIETETTYSNYRKFQAESRVVAIAPGR